MSASPRGRQCSGPPSPQRDGALSWPFPVEPADFGRTATEVPIAAVGAKPAVPRLGHDDLRPYPILAVLDRRVATGFFAGNWHDLAFNDLGDGEATHVPFD